MLIVFSGIDGSGKTLQIQLLDQWLRTQGKAVAVVKAYNEQAKIACRPFIETWTDDMAIMFLFQALHAQQYNEVIVALARGEVVIADRWDESYLAYHQNFGELSSQDDLRAILNRLAFRGLLPDVGFLIETPPPIARQRRSSRGKMERFEDRPDFYYERIQSAYRLIAEGRGWYILDGTDTPQSLHRQITGLLNRSLSF